MPWTSVGTAQGARLGQWSGQYRRVLSFRPGQWPHLLYRLHAYRGRRGEPETFGWQDYRDLIVAAISSSARRSCGSGTSVRASGRRAGRLRRRQHRLAAQLPDARLRPAASSNANCRRFGTVRIRSPEPDRDRLDCRIEMIPVTCLYRFTRCR